MSDSDQVMPRISAHPHFRHPHKSRPFAGVERYAFDEKANKAYCVLATGERRFDGRSFLSKGVIPPDGEGWP
jgi:L-fucose mutarotase/ribose pyranase (RbsD/FucU family)